MTDADFSALTVETVTRRAGMTRSAFYHYFGGLDELVMGLLEDFEREIRECVDPWLEGEFDQHTDYRALTTQYLSAMYEVFHQHRTVVSAVQQAASSSRAVFDQWQLQAVDYYISKTQTFIERQCTLGRSAVTDPAATARALILMNNAVGVDNMLRTEPQSPAAAGATVAQIWNAVIYGGTQTN